MVAWLPRHTLRSGLAGGESHCEVCGFDWLRRTVRQNKWSSLLETLDILRVGLLFDYEHSKLERIDRDKIYFPASMPFRPSVDTGSLSDQTNLCLAQSHSLYCKFGRSISNIGHRKRRVGTMATTGNAPLHQWPRLATIHLLHVDTSSRPRSSRCVLPPAWETRMLPWSANRLASEWSLPGPPS